MDRFTQKPLPTFSLGYLTIIPVVNSISQKPKPSSTKIGMTKYVKRDFDFGSLRVPPDEDEDRPSASKKRALGDQQRVSGSAASQDIGEAWVVPEAVNYDGYITDVMRLLSSKTSLYTYYSTGPDSPFPNLRFQEAAYNCENSFNFRSKMYCQDERHRLSLPFEIRSAIYAYAFAGISEPGVREGMLTTLPTVCRFLYIDINTFINRDHFQLYFAHPLTLQAYLAKLDCATSPFAKGELGLKRLRCVILDLSQLAKHHPNGSLLIPSTTPVPSRCVQQGLLTSALKPKPDPIPKCIQSAQTFTDPDGREPADWIPALTELLETYEVGKLVIRIGEGNVMKWALLPRRLKELVEPSDAKATEWQVVTNAGGWKHGMTG
jgi:hypothetical protein